MIKYGRGFREFPQTSEALAAPFPGFFAYFSGATVLPRCIRRGTNNADSAGSRSIKQIVQKVEISLYAVLDGTKPEGIRQLIRLIKSALMSTYHPGGTVAGIRDLEEQVRTGNGILTTGARCWAAQKTTMILSTFGNATPRLIMDLVKHNQKRSGKPLKYEIEQTHQRTALRLVKY